VKHSIGLRGLQSSMLAHKHKIVSVAADLRCPHLGLDSAAYTALCESVDHVIHVAWPVNFNLQLSSFQPSLEGVVNLMKLCLNASSLSTFTFVSSVSSVYNWKSSVPVPEAVPTEPRVAQDMGYAQSKWVVETMCERVMGAIDLPVMVMRVGQLVGDSVHGIWNETEAVPLMIKAGDTLGAMPIIEETVSWLPVDQAASIIIELLGAPMSSERMPCWHVVQRAPVTWMEVLQDLQQAGLELRPVPVEKWLQLVRNSDPDPISNPPIKLLKFWEDKYGGSEAVASHPGHATKLTQEASPTMRDLESPGGDLVQKWIRHWREIGFLKPVVE